MNPVSRRLSHIAKIIFALSLAAVLTLALFFGSASANFGAVCQPDGRPAVQIEGFTPFPNREVTIIAFDQYGKETRTKGKFDAQGNGTFPFGEPGVLYTDVFAKIEGSNEPLVFKNVKCDAPQKPPSQLTAIDVAPPSVSMQVGEQQVFTATGRDQNGNPYTLSNPTWTTSGGGTLAPSGTTATYTATQAGDFTITYGEGGTTIQGTATIHTTTPPQLTAIDVAPPSVSMQVGEQQVFTATGRDQNGNPYTLSNPTWTTSGGGTLTPSGTTATYTATQAGDFTITVTQGGTGIQGIAKVQVKPTETSALWIVGGVLALGIAAGAGYWLWGRPKVD